MKIAIFVDGKNFYAGWKEKAEGRKVDFALLAKWLVKKVGGTQLFGVYYYTGVEIGSNANSETQQKLSGFLDMLEMQSGFFVRRFPRKSSIFCCEDCGHENHFTQEKEVDTTMVADMLRFAAVDAFDALILISGDADYTPALEGVQNLGKQCFAATWGGSGLSARIRKVVFDHINLLEGIEDFNYQDDSVVEEEKTIEEIFVDEVQKAIEKFNGGYVGVNYFVTRWASNRLPESAASRRKILDELTEDGLIEVYDTEDGKKALRIPE